jgi:hypothetical protein
MELENKMRKITNKQLKKFQERMKEEKGMGGMQLSCNLLEFMGAVNILLIDAYEFDRRRDLRGITGAMNVFLERTGLKKRWIPVIPEGLDHPLFELDMLVDDE